MPQVAKTVESPAQPTPARRRQLIEIAYRLIAERGFEGLRFGDVASEAGINNATLWYHFPTKEDLIRGVTEHLDARLQSTEEEARPSFDAREDLRQMFAAAGRRIAADPTFFIVITELALRARRDPAIQAIAGQRDSFWQRRIVAMLERGIAQGVFRSDVDPEHAAIALMVQMKGVGHHAAVSPRGVNDVASVLAILAAQTELWLTGPAPSAHPPQRAGSL